METMKSPIPGQMSAGTDCFRTTPTKSRQSWRSHSFSFSSSFSNSPTSSYSSFSSNPNHYDHHDDQDPPSSPVASGIPFSWEQHPGIPKTPSFSNSRSSPNNSSTSSLISSSSTPRKLLPPPVITIKPNLTATRKLNIEAVMKIIYSKTRRKSSITTNPRDGFIGDPFTFALLKCCAKDNLHQCEVTGGNWKSTKGVSRTLSGRFGFIDLYASCKRTTDVLESKILVPPRSNRLVDRN